MYLFPSSFLAFGHTVLKGNRGEESSKQNQRESLERVIVYPLNQKEIHRCSIFSWIIISAERLLEVVEGTFYRQKKTRIRLRQKQRAKKIRNRKISPDTFRTFNSFMVINNASRECFKIPSREALYRKSISFPLVSSAWNCLRVFPWCWARKIPLPVAKLASRCFRTSIKVAHRPTIA